MTKRNMQDAYLLERQVLPAVIDMEAKGVRISKTIIPELTKWEKKFVLGEQYLKRIVGKDIKLGGKLMFNNLRKKGYINESKIVYTAPTTTFPNGNPRFGKDFLPDLIKDKKLKNVLVNRSRMSKVLTTYLRPWTVAYRKCGRFYPFFNQIRNEEDYGTMTGRFSSNFQQVPNNEAEDVLVNLRRFILPDKDEIIIQRDFKGQEMRIAAHYAEGNILQQFQDDPNFDVHQMVQDNIKGLTGKTIKRFYIKKVGFLKLYGGGPRALASRSDVDIELDEAKQFFKFYDKALPEFGELAEALKKQVKSGVLLRTWGGRLYDVEDPKFIEGRMREMYYKLINILIQGSAADMMKYAIALYYHHTKRRGRIMLTVHDELVVSIKKRWAKAEMKIMRSCMDNHPGWDLQILSDGKIGPNFGDLEKYDD